MSSEASSSYGKTDGLVTALIVVGSLIGVVILLLIIAHCVREYNRKKRDSELANALRAAKAN